MKAALRCSVNIKLPSLNMLFLKVACSDAMVCGDILQNLGYCKTGTQKPVLFYIYGRNFDTL